MTEKELIPDAITLMESIQKTEGWNPVYRKQLEDLFKVPVFTIVLSELLRTSDEMLKTIGLTDLTNPVAVQNAMRAQGKAAGFAEAVEMFCTLASTPENPSAEENVND